MTSKKIDALAEAVQKKFFLGLFGEFLGKPQTSSKYLFVKYLLT